MTQQLEQEFVDYIKTFKHNKSIEADSKIFTDPIDKNDLFSYCETPYFCDFNRELIEGNEEIFAIRCDDDFFVCAVLPFKYTELSLDFIIKHLWPDEEYEIKPDSITKPDED
jgi:hypothetical protein